MEVLGALNLLNQILNCGGQRDRPDYKEASEERRGNRHICRKVSDIERSSRSNLEGCLLREEIGKEGRPETGEEQKVVIVSGRKRELGSSFFSRKRKKGEGRLGSSRGRVLQPRQLISD